MRRALLSLVPLVIALLAPGVASAATVVGIVDRPGRR